VITQLTPDIANYLILLPKDDSTVANLWQNLALLDFFKRQLIVEVWHALFVCCTKTSL
jgi:hypothetical protein